MNTFSLRKLPFHRLSEHTKKSEQKTVEPKSVTITAERLSDHSHITFTISSNKTIEQLRALLNHHLPPLVSNRFDLYSYQRGALIHFRPSSFKLDYFPVIFDQSVLLLKMDDRINDDIKIDNASSNRKKLRGESKQKKHQVFKRIFKSKSKASDNKAKKESASATNVTCLSLLKQFFHQSTPNNVNTISETNIVTY